MMDYTVGYVVSDITTYELIDFLHTSYPYLFRRLDNASANQKGEHIILGSYDHLGNLQFSFDMYKYQGQPAHTYTPQSTDNPYSYAGFYFPLDYGHAHRELVTLLVKHYGGTLNTGGMHSSYAAASEKGDIYAYA